MADVAYGSLPFAEQAEFFRRKVNLPTSGWTDIYAHEHDWAFVVAGANRDAIVSDFRTAVQKAIHGQSTLEGFRKDFDAIVARHGWDYNGGRNWRSRVIYDTNLGTSYAAGRWEQLQEAPYWEYVHQDWVEHPRPLHVSWGGLVLERGHPWFRTHFPPNGWFCHCEVRGLWFSDLVRMGKKGPDQAPPITWTERTIGARSELGPRTVRVPEGIDPGFEYAPGAARKNNAVPTPRPAPEPAPKAAPGLPDRRPSDELPVPRRLPADSVLPQGLAPETYVDDFLGQLGAAAEPAVVRDVIGERLVVGKSMFDDVEGAILAGQDDQARHLPLLAHALLSPDEIWTRIEWLATSQRAVVRRRYVARFVLDGQDTPTVAVFETSADGWSGVTFSQGAGRDADEWRFGVRLYQRQDGE